MNKSFILLAIFSFVGYVTAEEVFDPNKMVGTWGDAASGYNRYSDDGMLVSWGNIPSAGIEYEILSNYELEDRDDGTYSCITVVGSSHPEIMPVGEYWCDKIVKVSDTEFTYMNSDGETTTMLKN